ncbi:hypothetical protein BGZ80_004682 [Entomortierella chlamydospora]|uniref:Crinkler effector protein N-terminal domain-containing protein n=1 Tax=Entomortierella chlamydospora TaxID=101097 RepID=A0A9P6MLT5_9FUNG|nr:hypothetical protein BGZ79_003403 [Entomortierella chlamydospora]KAG0007417.1 hypothetical protein BGZ80_004682 [Entomortierella chlamydospora]
MASAATAATTLNLRFAVIGEPETTQPFKKGVDRTMDTDDLKQAIYDSKKDSVFINIEEYSSLVFYRVSEFSEDDTKPQEVMTGSIKRYFKGGAEEDHIHIIVKRPKEDRIHIAVKPPQQVAPPTVQSRSHSPYYSTILLESPFSHLRAASPMLPYAAPSHKLPTHTAP